MKKIIFISALLLGTMSVFANQKEAPKAEQKSNEKDKKEAYQCPMKCEGAKTYAKKGKCPSCTMDLKKVK